MKIKTKKIILLSIFVIFLNSCSNIAKKDYVVIDSSSSKQPNWVSKNNYNSKNSEYKYFISKSENINERLCVKSSSARGFTNVAAEIATEILNQYEEFVSNNNLKIQSYSNEKLQQDIKMYLAGIETEELYWEKRLYNKTENNDKTQQQYVCYTLLKMSKQNYEKIIKLSIDKMFNLIEINNKNEVKQQITDKVVNNIEESEN